MYRGKHKTVGTQFNENNIPPELLASGVFSSVSDFITNNTTTLITRMTPLTYNLPGLTIILPTQQLFQDALQIIIDEYGYWELDPQQQRDLATDIWANFRRLCQLLILERLVNMNDILRNNYANRTYSAASGQRIYEAVSEAMSEAENNYHSNSTGESTTNGNTITNETGTYASTGTASGSRDYDGTTSVINQSNTDDRTEVGQVNQRSVQIGHSMPTQAIDGTTANFPNAISTTYVVTPDGGFIPTNRDLKVPDLNQAMANSATSNYGVTEANTANMQSTTNGKVDETRGVIESNTGSDTYSSNSSSNGNLSSNARDNTFGMSEGGSLQVGSGHNDTQSRTQESSGTGVRTSGFTTTAVFANQLATVWNILMQHGTPWEWWLERFTWIRGIQ